MRCIEVYLTPSLRGVIAEASGELKIEWPPLRYEFSVGQRKKMRVRGRTLLYITCLPYLCVLRRVRARGSGLVYMLVSLSPVLPVFCIMVV